MNRKFIFDVDGTLTPSRGQIDKDFAAWFSEFCESSDVYLVTGSDRAKTIEQVGDYIYNKCKRVYNCSGSDVYEGNKNVKSDLWHISEVAHQFLENELFRSKFVLRTGNHIEQRPGMVNFSIVGRNADSLERKSYVKWDNETNERIDIAERFNLQFPSLKATVGGETGIDIAPKGCDKSQILYDFDDSDTILFFGDRMDEDGNDYPLAQANKKGMNYHVKDWRDTWSKLNAYITNGS